MLLPPLFCCFYNCACYCQKSLWGLAGIREVNVMRSDGVLKAVLGLRGFGFRASDLFKLGCRRRDESRHFLAVLPSPQL